MTKYDNCDWSRLARTGGVSRAVIGADGQGQGNGGVSIPCRGCFIQSREKEACWLTEEGGMGAGPFLPGPNSGCQPIWLSIANVAEIWIGGAPGETVDIVYLLG